MIRTARAKGFTIKVIANIANIHTATIYNYICGNRNLSKEKEEKIRTVLTAVLDL